MKTISLVLSLLLANSTDALTIRESNNIEERTITEALNDVVIHQEKKHKHHHKHESDSDEDVQTKTDSASTAVS